MLRCVDVYWLKNGGKVFFLKCLNFYFGENKICHFNRHYKKKTLKTMVPGIEPRAAAYGMQCTENGEFSERK